MRKITYKSSGVDISKANVFLKKIAKEVDSTMSAGVIKRKGAFASMFALSGKMKDPVLVSSTDGVGTKLLVAKHINKHDTIGIDCVAMNVNDILCVGAKPLFFLDYLACGRLDPKVLAQVVKGVVKGCKESGCSLIGGETAEMPGVYKKDEYDLAGFALGVVEKNKIIDGSKIRKGDRLIGLPSSGLHSNGFSLVRKVLSLKEQKQLGKEILKPTKIYVKEILPLIKKFPVKGLAHMTGGAYYEKLTKILPKGKCFQIDPKSWPVPKIFHILREKGKIEFSEMYRTFNMGLGLICVVDQASVRKVSAYLKKRKIRHYHIGEVVNDTKHSVKFV